MILDLDRHPSGRSELSLAGPLELGLSDGRPASVQISGTAVVQNLESRVLVSGTLEAAGSAECGRCLEEFPLTWDFPVDLMVLRNVDTDENEGDTILILQQKGEVDLREALRECAVLGFPQAPVCRSDCKGLCPECGIDRNRASCECEKEDVDPRWAGLPE